ncbi:MAG: clostripain-related cysteine peptidase [Bacteroidaceae bacterium]|nr:clostripain-related cysteine peptidase [Bacteroidaceae bacterium]
MIADNSLSGFIASDLDEACQGYLKAPGNMNLLVYIDNHANNDGLPVLMNVRRNEKRDTLICDTLRTWSSDHNSADPAMMSQVIKEAFSGVFDTPVKGIVLSSHGFAWTPSKHYEAVRARNKATLATPELQWLGQDTKPKENFMELWDLHDGLKNSGVELTHIMFDACFMSNAETAYELRDCAQYLVASACEIPGDGYNYIKVMPELSEVTGRDDLQNALCKVIDCYGEEYNDDGPACAELCLTDLTYMDEIAAAYKKLRTGKTLDVNEVISYDSLSTSGKPLAKMQSYGRMYYLINNYYDYFDLAECASKLGDDGTLSALLKKAVIREFHASMFSPVPMTQATTGRIKGRDTEAFPFTSCCGISVSLPEMFEVADRYKEFGSTSRPSLQKMQSAYARTQWSKFMEQQTSD